jgi:hypothetical protein
MKKKLLMLLGMALFVMQGFSQVLYSESFSTLTLSSAGVAAVPSSMKLINTGNKSGNTASGNAPFNASPYLTTAWVANAVTAGTSPADTAAESTSWLNPVGAADKWLITPSITGIANNTYLTWEGFASDATYSDGYEVWVSVAAGANSAPTAADFTAITANKVFSITAEGSTAFVSHAIDLSAFIGQTIRVGFRNNSNDKFHLYIDDIKVTVVNTTTDIKLVSVSPTGLSSWGAIGSTKTIGGKVFNNGSAPITSFTASYSDGLVTGTKTFTGLNIAYYGTYTFSITTPYTILSAADANLKVYVDLASDPIHTNDTLLSSVAGYSFVPNHKVVFEEGTGTWCGWCVRGAVYMDSIAEAYPNSCVPIAVHDGDPMANTVYDNGVSGLVSGYPSILVDRSKGDPTLGDPSDAFTEYTNHKNDFALADLSVDQTYNSTTRVLTLVVNANIASSFTNNNSLHDIRLAAVITENQVHGTATTYNQHNYYAGGGSGVMQGAGHVFQNEPDPVLAANMYYNYVARSILGGFTGLANSLPSVITAGNVYSHNFTYTVPAGYNLANIKINPLLIDAKNNIIYNGNSFSLNTATSVNSIETKKLSFSLYPNPASSILNMDLNLEEADNVMVSIINCLGETVIAKNIGKIQSGTNALSFNVSELAFGAYTVYVKTTKGVGVGKFIK